MQLPHCREGAWPDWSELSQLQLADCIASLLVVLLSSGLWALNPLQSMLTAPCSALTLHVPRHLCPALLTVPCVLWTYTGAPLEPTFCVAALELEGKGRQVTMLGARLSREEAAFPRCAFFSLFSGVQVLRLA